MANNFLANAGFLKLYWSVSGELAINVYGLRIPDGIIVNQTLANTVGAAVKSAYTTNLAALQGPNTVLLKAGLRDFRTPNQPEWRDTGAQVQGSEAAGQNLPNQVAMCITLRTAGSGRSFRGRTYIPGWSETQNSATGQAVAGASTAGVNFVTGVKNAVSASGMFLAVVSRPSDEYRLTRSRWQNGLMVEEELLSTTSQKTGGVADVTIIEARTANWEQQRRRVNGRGGGAPAVLVVASSAA